MIVCDFCHAHLPDSESKKSVGVAPGVSQQEVHVCKNCLPQLVNGIHKLIQELKITIKRVNPK